jgi:DDE superfamily endonuclease
VVDKKCQKVICTAFTNGKQHDFRLFKESKTRFHSSIRVLTDSGYQGLQKLHAKTQMPKKKSKKHPLTKADKENNKQLSSERVVNENVIGCLKRFKIIADRYRNRRKRFGLRFNLIAGIYNWELHV